MQSCPSVVHCTRVLYLLGNQYIYISVTSLLPRPGTWDRLRVSTLLVIVLHPISRSSNNFGTPIAWRIIKTNWNIRTSPSLLYTQTVAASYSPKWNWITWCDIVTVFVPLGVLERHTITASDMLTCICITAIRTKAFDGFLEGFFIIEGQPHLNPHQNHCWCDSLAK